MRVGYHASPNIFNFPKYENILEELKLDEKHKNGALGLWCAAEKNWISGFGKNIYKVNCEDKNTKVINIKDFVKSCNEKDTIEDYKKWREEMIKNNIKILAILETTNKIDMYIVLDFSVIKSFKKIM